MVDLDTNTAIIIAAITASSAIAGGLISSGTNYLIERQRSKNEAIKAYRDKEAQETELRNQAYIKFLSIREDSVYETLENLEEFFNPGLVEERIALIFTYGSPRVTSLLAEAYPFESWEELENVKKAVMRELVTEKGETWVVPLKGSIVTKSGMSGNLTKKR